MAQASAGLACRVDGGCGYGYDGNVCMGGPRHYSDEATDASHTVWLYIRPRDDVSPVCAPAPAPPAPPPPPVQVLGRR